MISPGPVNLPRKLGKKVLESSVGKQQGRIWGTDADGEEGEAIAMRNTGRTREEMVFFSRTNWRCKVSGLCRSVGRDGKRQREEEDGGCFEGERT